MSSCARRERADLVFHPAAATIYPPGFRTSVEVQGWQDVLEGVSRPGHFRGVATVVLKLLNIVQPDVAYFGQKDAQQVRLLERMVHDLDVPVTLRRCPIVREPDGLALSSRNGYLMPAQRQAAPCSSRTLDEARRLIVAGERRAVELVRQATDRLAAVPEARVDYVAVVDDETLAPLDVLRGRVLVVAAVYFGATRLIDNVCVEIP